MADNTFYVIYNTVTKQYLSNVEDTFGSYDDAAQFDSAADAEIELDTLNANERVVGPCIEGETP